MKWKFWEKPSTLPALVEAEVYTPEDKSMEVALKITQAFATGPILKPDLDPHGISEMTVKVNGVFVKIRFHSKRFGYELHAIYINSDSFIGNDAEAEMIRKAAVARAHILLKEQLEALHETMFKEEYINGISSK